MAHIGDEISRGPWLAEVPPFGWSLMSDTAAGVRRNIG